LRAKILGSVPGDQGSAAQPAEGLAQGRLGEQVLHALETGSQQRRIGQIEHVADVIVGGDFRDPEQGLAVRPPLAFLKAALESAPAADLAKSRRIFVLDGARAACDWDRGTGVPGLFPPALMPQTVRQDFVANSNDSFWLVNDRSPIRNDGPIVGAMDVPQNLRTRAGLLEIEARLDSADGLPGRKPILPPSVRRSRTPSPPSPMPALAKCNSRPPTARGFRSMAAREKMAFSTSRTRIWRAIPVTSHFTVQAICRSLPSMTRVPSSAQS
jgi:hypothetical protein